VRAGAGARRGREVRLLALAKPARVGVEGLWAVGTEESNDVDLDGRAAGRGVRGVALDGSRQRLERVVVVRRWARRVLRERPVLGAGRPARPGGRRPGFVLPVGHDHEDSPRLLALGDGPVATTVWWRGVRVAGPRPFGRSTCRACRLVDAVAVGRVDQAD